MENFGRILITIGVVFISIGGILFALGKIGFIGKLPGDIHFKAGNFTFYFPIVTCIIISLILSIILYLIKK